jgi:4-hydroxybenzoate polyprenyltransferase
MYVKKIIRILRLNQMIKHIFIFPGMIFGYYLTKEIPTFYTFLLGIISIILISSANYTINEITDRKFDIYHDLKKNRNFESHN